ncbi:MAG: OmcA/MtrC family decaheme c-type cytochrome [Bryobacteraceae bacterium]
MSQAWFAGLTRRSRIGVLAAGAAVILAAGVVKTVDERTVNFVRPGLKITVSRADVATDGTLRVQFKVADPQNVPLDRDGITSPGVISLSFVAAYIPKDGTQYTAYTVRTQTSPINGRSAVQASADTGGTYTRIAEGEYTYTFGTKLPASADRTATHSILIYGARNLTEFDFGQSRADVVYTWVPAGGAVTNTRDVIRSATCNKCHTQLAFHGGNRRSMEGCILCHQPQTVDPDTGNSVDMPVMIHKIHMGAELPSVQAGQKYIIIGNAQSINDYSHVEFPANPRRCGACHETELPAAQRPAQADAHLKKPSRVACGACHDNVNFATGQGHVNLPQATDNLCSNCHIPQGELDFDASITGAHTVATRAPSLPGTTFSIVSIDDGVAGRKPRVTFTVKDKFGNTITPTEMTSLSLVLAGPTTDYATYISETARGATDVGGGRFAYTFTASIPADAKGSFSIGMEGYRNWALLQGTALEQTVRDAGTNVVRSFSVDGKPVVQRRQVVALAKCNNCHGFLELHGSNRNQIEQCVLCHNPNTTDAARRPATAAPNESIHMATMIHRIHAGEQGRDYIIYGFGGSVNNFSEIGYPSPLTNCNACHVNNSQRLPLQDTLLPVQDPRGIIKNPGPETAACLACHATKSAAAHAASNSNAIGESCSTCHGVNGEFSVDRVHVVE